MKRLLLLVAAILICASQVQSEEYRIYESGKPVIALKEVKPWLKK